MYRTVAQLDSVMTHLATFFPQLCRRILLPNRSVLGKRIYALRMRAGSASNRRGVLIIGGMHARELMNPDAIVELQLNLVRSYLLGTPITYGGRTWSATDIKIMLETLDIWTLPCANPDGREYVINQDDMWRKNRRNNPGTSCDGVDLNRNCDFVWGVTNSATSCDACADTFVGPNAFSEPESKNVKYLCDAHRIRVFCDVHSYSELVLYPWGHAPTQTTDPTQRFPNLPTGTCMPLSPPGYQEYMLPSDQLRFQTVARQIVADIRAVRLRNYTPQTIRALYACTGTSADYVYSRHIVDPALRKTYGFSFETGPYVGNAPDSFHPDDPTLIKRDTKAAMLALIQQSVCAIEFIGTMFLSRKTGVQAFRELRDNLFLTTKTGRGWISLFERIQLPVLGAVLTDASLAKEATSLLERAGNLLESDDTKVSARDVKRGLAVLDSLAERDALSGLRRDLAALREQLASASGKSVRTILQDLLKPRRAPARKVSVRRRAQPKRPSKKRKR